ncbi:hypothetical protein MJO29_004671 [Puccinia striiformis f. sp. tritici]|nr:hypothetical protein MJO29_004671 [Puccinia striiformis f. sp. tritici]
MAKEGKESPKLKIVFLRDLKSYSLIDYINQNNQTHHYLSHLTSTQETNSHLLLLSELFWDKPSPPPQDSQAQGRSKSHGRSRGGAVRSKKRNCAATVQAMSQPLSSQENNSQPNKAKEEVDPDHKTVELPPNKQGV